MTDTAKSLPRLAVLAMAAVIAAVVLAGWSLYEGKRDLCHGRDISLNVLQAVLVDARENDHRAGATRFYDRQLARIQQARC